MLASALPDSNAAERPRERSMKTLHVETGRHFYGGAQQVIYLLRGLAAKGIEARLVCPPDSEVADAANAEGIPLETIPCAGDVDLRFPRRTSRSDGGGPRRRLTPGR